MIFYRYIARTSSTNSTLLAMSEKEELPSGFILRTGYQTAGRGQTGNKWESQPFRNLLFSIFLRHKSLPANRAFSISEATALSIHSALSHYITDNENVKLKWPNDIVYCERKIAGILIENYLQTSMIERSIIGVGINVNQTSFNESAGIPTSLRNVTGNRYYYDLMDILRVFRQEFLLRCNMLTNSEFARIHEDYLAHLYRNEPSKRYRYKDNNGFFEAELYNVAPDGRLTLKREDGTLSSYSFKEVSLVI
jgi:BirA family biotin operon repressor/biotin-[acetyl-CoA-carboxylase] ligase